MKVSAYQKRKIEIEELKKENLKLRNDVYKVIDGDLQTTTLYKVHRETSEGFEKMIWSGSTTFKQDKP